MLSNQKGVYTWGVTPKRAATPADVTVLFVPLLSLPERFSPCVDFMSSVVRNPDSNLAVSSVMTNSYTSYEMQIPRNSWQAKSTAKVTDMESKIPQEWVVEPADLEAAKKQKDLTESFMESFLIDSEVDITRNDSMLLDNNLACIPQSRRCPRHSSAARSFGRISRTSTSEILRAA